MLHFLYLSTFPAVICIFLVSYPYFMYSILWQSTYAFVLINVWYDMVICYNIHLIALLYCHFACSSQKVQVWNSAVLLCPHGRGDAFWPPGESMDSKIRGGQNWMLGNIINWKVHHLYLLCICWSTHSLRAENSPIWSGNLFDAFQLSPNVLWCTYLFTAYCICIKAVTSFPIV